jgi:cyclopropane fatty-acyl-phospholipid synthase-like methyltransferase
LHKLGYNVTGIDISPENIAWCKKYEEQGLEFFIHDMRKSFRQNYFNVVLNLFTSFGYFEQDKHHHQVVNAAAESLKRNGLFIIDFLNTTMAAKHLVPGENKNISDVNFNIERKFKKGFFVKDICVTHGRKTYQFEERVKGFSKKDFENLFNSSGLKPEYYFGDYHLSEFDENKSERLIVVGRK